MRMRFFYFLIIVSGIQVIYSGCGTRYDGGTIPETPANLTEINSEYDDYNSYLHMINSEMPLIFSTNRQSKGGDFDFIYYYLDINRDLDNGKYYIGETDYKGDSYLRSAHLFNALSHANTPGFDEFGPYMFFGKDPFPYSNKSIFMYSNNQEGSQDIKFVDNLNSQNYTEPQSITFLNSDKDDAYPSVSADSSAIYFCSNRGGDFDIYRADIDNKISFYENITGKKDKTITKELTLSTSSDDKCPYVNGNLIVFISNRPGGYGGYDLYYSQFVNGTWTEPKNFGEKINSAYNEYRPVVQELFEFTNDFMLFSSDRPGGKGGFDLYYVGIPKMIK